MIKSEIKNDLDFSGFDDILQSKINERLNKIGRFLAQYAQKHHRYKHRTGNLKNATRFWVNKAKARVRLYISEEQADYGKYVHEGHGTWKEDRFIDNAILKNQDYINSEMNEAIAEAAAEWNRKNRL